MTLLRSYDNGRETCQTPTRWNARHVGSIRVLASRDAEETEQAMQSWTILLQATIEALGIMEKSMP